MVASSQASSGNVIPADTSVFTALQTLQTSDPASYAAIVRPANPPPGIGGFLFDIPGDEEVRLTATISRHFVEDNTPISDHIALDPERVTLRGLVAELTSGLPPQAPQQTPPNPLPLQGILQAGAQTFGQLQGQVAALLAAPPPIVGAILPVSVSSALATAQSYYSGGGVLPSQLLAALGTLNQLTNFIGTNPNQIPPTPNQSGALSSQQSLYQYFQAKAGPSITNLTRQATAALYFQQSWWGRQLFSVETPWGIWTNMAIQDIRMMQAKTSKYISDFAIIFERIRIAGDLTVAAGLLSNRNAINQAPMTTNGTSTGAPLPIPLPSYIPQ